MVAPVPVLVSFEQVNDVLPVAADAFETSAPADSDVVNAAATNTRKIMERTKVLLPLSRIV
jgi:hypothetical protein